MAVLLGIVWCLGTIIVMFLTGKFYLPKLFVRVNSLKSDAEPLGASKECKDKTNVGDSDIEIEEVEKENLLEVEGKEFELNQKKLVIRIVFGALFAGLAGFFAFTYVYGVDGWWINLIKMTVAVWTLACIYVTDAELKIIPNLCSVILFLTGVVTLILELIFNTGEVLNWLINGCVTAALCLIVLLILSRLTKGGLGMGDVKILTTLGFCCGLLTVVMTLFFALLVCTVVSTVLLLLKKRGLKDTLPLGPFIYWGYIVAVLLSLM